MGFSWRGLGLMLALASCGCWRPDAPTVAQLEQGLIWMFPGVEGGPWELRPALKGLRKAGVDAAVRIYDWQRWSFVGALLNLIDEPRNRAHAAQVAKDIEAYRQSYPRSPIDLVGYSGGGGLALLVAEALPPDVRLRHIILVQAAVSPQRDLRPALARMDGRIINLYSPNDWIILGLGTTLFGTMERELGPSAGNVGFDMQRMQRLGIVQRIEERAWSPDMWRTCHLGGHLGIRSGRWNQQVVAPYLLGAAEIHRQSDD